MMITEFEKRTGYFPTLKEYEAIERAYTEFDGDKNAFCKAYKKNEGGIAEKIQNEVNVQTISDQHEAEKLVESYKARIAELEKALDREQEWRPYTSTQNVAQDEYKELAKGIESGFSYYMTDDEAIAWICDEFDFDPKKITIIHEIDEYEINRHHQLRKTGRKIDRRPVYCATDYHYIRFNTSRNYYEVWSDELRPFYD